jgi:hypothetical protein
MKQTVITFRTLRETKHTIRFEEVVEGQMAEPIVGTIYVKKGALAKMGVDSIPTGLRLTMEVIENGKA